MKKIVLGAMGTMALLAAACMERSEPTSPQLRPEGASRTIAVASTNPKTGAIFTTNAACTGTDLNIYGSKADVYIDGGPTHPGAAGVPDGDYAVKVTNPSGSLLLGTTIGSGNDLPVHVTNGEFANCYQLQAILIKGSDATPGYDDTDNSGGEYKVWLSNGSDFLVSKTDNFKVKTPTGCDPNDPLHPCGPPPAGLLSVLKWYDVNANGVHDLGESTIDGWKINIQDGSSLDRFTPVAIVLDPDTYVVSEYNTVQTNWLHTTPSTVSNVVVTDGGSPTVEFGNVCTGAGGGLTLGFWSNKNGTALETSADLLFLSGLHLRNANGTDFDPTTTKALSSWLLAATATNMANMLSAQLAAMELNVRHGFVSGAALIYAPGTPSANSLGYSTVTAVMADAEAQLAANANTTAAGTNRTIQEAIKNALDRANNNLNFVQSAPCAFSFAN